MLRTQPHRRVPHDPAGHAQDDAGPVRAHRQRLVGRAATSAAPARPTTRPPRPGSLGPHRGPSPASSAPRSITCNVVAPGPIVTAMTDGDARRVAAGADAVGARSGRLGTAEEVRRGRRLPLLRRRRATSPARSFPSTAASAWDTDRPTVSHRRRTDPPRRNHAMERDEALAAHPRGRRRGARASSPTPSPRRPGSRRTSTPTASTSSSSSWGSRSASTSSARGGPRGRHHRRPGRRPRARQGRRRKSDERRPADARRPPRPAPGRRHRHRACKTPAGTRRSTTFWATLLAGRVGRGSRSSASTRRELAGAVRRARSATSTRPRTSGRRKPAASTASRSSGFAAAADALADAGELGADPAACGVIAGTGIGGLDHARGAT